MPGVKAPAQRFVAAYGPIAHYFRPRRHRLSAAADRHPMAHRFQSWRAVTEPAAASRVRSREVDSPSCLMTASVFNKLTMPSISM